MRIEGSHFRFLTPVLRRWLRKRSGEELLFSFSYTQWSQAFKTAGEACGLASFGPPALHQLRHGGASTDAAAKDRSLAEIQQHGRWADPRSVRRYAKGGRVTQQLWQLEPKVRRRCLAAARSIGEILSGTLSTTWPSYSSSFSSSFLNLGSHHFNRDYSNQYAIISWPYLNAADPWWWWCGRAHAT